MIKKPTYKDLEQRIRLLEEESIKNKQAENLYRTIFENTGTAMSIIDEDTTIILVNGEYEKLCGYTKNELEGKKSWTDFVFKEDLGRMMAFHEQRRIDKDAAPKNYEFRLKDRKGNIKNIFLTVDMIPDTKMSVTSLMDITDRQQAEEALRESQEYTKILFTNSIVPQIVMDAETGIYVDCNEAAVKIYGYASREEVLNKTPFDVSAPSQYDGSDSATEAQKHIQICRRDGSHFFEWHYQKPNGEIWDADVHIMLFQHRGKLLMQFTLQDITPRKKAEEELKEKRRELANIIEFLPDATLVIDRQGRIIAWNRALETMTGVRKKDMLGKNNYEYALPFYGERRPILIDYALHPDKGMEKRYTAIQRMGDILFGEAFTPNLLPGNVHLSGTSSVFRDNKGEIIAAIECIRDNTERKKFEERLNRAEKMEALGTLAGGVAHDLNNVLGILVGYSELLTESLPKDSSPKKFADIIMQSSVKGAAIIQDLLTLARRGVNVQEVVDLNRLILDCLKTPEFEKLKYYHPNMKVWTEFEDGLLNIKGSPIHLGKTIMNLVLNAAEALSGHGKVMIRTENRYLDRPVHGYDEIKEGDYAVLTVSDTGSGISADDLGKIFEPFYTKKVMGRSGTGLGLAVVWGTVKDHNGYIDVQSKEGKGSTFTLYFPVTREVPEKIKEAKSSVSYTGKGESILVVDDVQEQRELAVNMMGRLGYRVEAVASGEEAIEYLKNKKADLVVLDMIMDPGIDGLETYRRIIKINSGQKTIIVSGFSETDRVREAQEIGAGAFVRKPYILEKISLVIRAELDRKQD